MDFPVKEVFNRDQVVFPVMPGEKYWNGPARQSYTLYFLLTLFLSWEFKA